MSPARKNQTGELHGPGTGVSGGQFAAHSGATADTDIDLDTSTPKRRFRIDEDTDPNDLSVVEPWYDDYLETRYLYARDDDDPDTSDDAQMGLPLDGVDDDDIDDFTDMLTRLHKSKVVDLHADRFQQAGGHLFNADTDLDQPGTLAQFGLYSDGTGERETQVKRLFRHQGGIHAELDDGRTQRINPIGRMMFKPSDGDGSR